jgi:hypothetical protein
VIVYCEQTSTFIIYADRAAMVVNAILLIIVMTKTTHSRLHIKNDAKWIRDSRRAAFILVTICAGVAMLMDFSPASILPLFLSTSFLLIVNVAALDFRPPIAGLRSAWRGVLSIEWEPLRRMLASFRNSERH